MCPITSGLGVKSDEKGVDEAFGTVGSKTEMELPKRFGAGELRRDDGGWKQAYEGLGEDIDSLEKWEVLIQKTEEVLTRVRSGHALDVGRSVFDKFLTKFPLLFGYWIKYAQLEQQYGDDEVMKMVYERSVAAFPNSIELWLQYLDLETDRDKKRVLFQRASRLVGQDFLSHPFWDKYLEFCAEDDQVEVVKVLEAIIRIPLHQYARYYEKYRELGAETSESQQVFQTTATKTNERWTYESKITRNYFHVVELEKDQLDNWDAYLDYMEESASRDETVALYERALIPGALYEGLWLRYARWLQKNEQQSQEDVRNIYRRAAVVVPRARPQVRYQWSLYEESVGNTSLARDILDSLSSSISTRQFTSEMVAEWVVYRVGLERRTAQTKKQFTDFMESELKNVRDDVRLPVYAALYAWHIWKVENKAKRAHDIFQRYYDKGVDSAFFCIRHFNFSLETQPITYTHQLWEKLMVDAAVPPSTLTDISHVLMDSLQTSTEPNAMQLYLDVDREINSPLINRKLWKRKLNKPQAVEKRLKLENGHPGVEIAHLEVIYEKKDPFAKYYNLINDYIR